MSFEPASANGLRRELEQAEQNLNHHLGERKHHDEEAARWQQVVEQLKGTINLMESPATAVKRAPMVGAGAGKHGPRVRWEKQWPGVLEECRLKYGRYPFKAQLISYIKIKFQLTEACANAAVNNAIRRGGLALTEDRCSLAQSLVARAS